MNNWQLILDQLEAYKRLLGRRYAQYKSESRGFLTNDIARKYNKVECSIKWLVDEYHCTRKSKSYLLEV